jgi:hypothetical protein
VSVDVEVPVEEPARAGGLVRLALGWAAVLVLGGWLVSECWDAIVERNARLENVRVKERKVAQDLHETDDLPRLRAIDAARRKTSPLKPVTARRVMVEYARQFEGEGKMPKQDDFVEALEAMRERGLVMDGPAGGYMLTAEGKQRVTRARRSEKPMR